jgi:hypothetical protein
VGAALRFESSAMAPKARECVMLLEVQCRAVLQNVPARETRSQTAKAFDSWTIRTRDGLPGKQTVTARQWTERQIDRQIERQTERQTDRQVPRRPRSRDRSPCRR